MKSVKADNPAGRLYLILNEARSKSDKLQTKLVWNEVLTNGKDVENIFTYLSSLQDLVKDVKNKVVFYLPDLQSHYLSLYHNVEKVVGATNLDAPWNSYKPLLSKEVMVELRFCWIGLMQFCSEQEIGPDKLKLILNDIRILVSEVLESDIDGALKEVIIDLLMGSEQAIIEYKVRGPEYLQKNLERTIGAISYNYKLFKQNDSKPLADKLWAIMVAMNEVTTFAINSQSLLVGASFTLKQLTT